MKSIVALLGLVATPFVAEATTFTMTTPSGIAVPTAYPQAGGVVMVMVGANGNVYYQFSDPTGAFVGYQNSGNPSAFRGNPFTINNPITMNCGVRSCTQYFGGSISAMYVRFSANDGDTSSGNFDFNDISLVMNGTTVGNWSTIQTEITNINGTASSGFQTGFGDNTFATGWFTTTNQTLLNNMLSTNQTTTQVFDRDPNDNYWDFSIGPALSNQSLRTIAPGYTITKTANRATFTAVGDVITYTYVVENIGSVDIRNLAVSDNKISSVTCNKTTIVRGVSGGTPDFATCTGTYTVTQADMDAGRVVNVASATGRPDFGVLGAVTATATVTGPPAAPALSLTKTTTLATFGNAGTTVPYSFTVSNTGNVTLTNVRVTDPKLPGLTCTVATLAPTAQQTCTGSYTVTQADVDAWIQSGTQLTNTATASGTPPAGGSTSTTATRALNGPTSAPALTVATTVTPTTYASVGTDLNFSIRVTNTGNVTFPAAPAISDPLVTGAGGSVSCPAGPVAPGASITCTASYTVTQANIDARSLTNTATASITVGGVTASGSGNVTVNATANPALTISKRLASASPASFNTPGTVLSYEYVLINTGNITLSAAQVSDNRIASVSCPAGTIAPGASLTCTASYTVTQTDVDAGGITNIASGSALPAGTTTRITTASPSSVTVPAIRTPGMAMDKVAPSVPGSSYVVGAVITYTYTITNSGNTTLSSAINVTDDKIGTFVCGSVPLAPGATTSCTRNYTLTATDIAGGFIQNTASATSGTITSNTDVAAIPQSSAPAITLAKVANTVSFSALSNTLSYTFTVTNSGATQIVSLQPITINDPKITSISCSQPATLNPTESFTCTGSYTPITQAEMDAGKVVNTATASFTQGTPNGPVTITSPSASATVPANVTPSMTLAKTGPADFNAVGQVITFNFTITNTGLQTIATATVTDPMLPGLSCTRTNIAPAGTATCSGPYTVTQADMDAGVINNSASVAGTTPSGGSASATATESIPIAPGAGTRSMVLDKTSISTSFATVGQTIPFTFAVRNTGTLTLTGITVTDSLIPAFSCTISTLAPGATNSTCTASYVITQADIDRGSLTNDASAAASGATTVTDTVTLSGPTAAPALTLGKAASPTSFTTVGQTITYTLTARNTGNVTLTNVQITDPLFSPALSCTIPTFPPGAINSSCTGSYVTTQADVDRGRVDNTATASATPPGGGTVNTTGTATVSGPAAAGGIEVTKTETDGSGSFGAVGTSESYTFTVRNTGNVTLSNISINDPLTGFTCTIANLAPGATATTCASSASLQSSVTITQAMFDAGSLANTVSVSARTPGGAPISDTASLTLPGPTQTPAITMAKSVNTGANFTAPGQIVTYNYVVTNTGNVTLTAPITVTDNRIASVSCPAVPVAGLLPTASITCTASYTVTQADIDAGSVTNNATATISQSLAGVPNPVVATSSDSETVSAAQNPAMSLTKSITTGTSSSFDAVGDTLSYTFLVRNTGNTTITGPIQINDTRLGAPFTCLAGPLAPAASGSCQATYTIAQADLDAGSVANTARSFTGPAGTPTLQSSPSTATAFALQSPRLTVAKSTTENQASDFTLGNVIDYSYVVTNAGNVTIPAPIAVNDNLATVTCPAGSLAPGASMTCTSGYTLTANDIALGVTTNNASANATFNGNPVPTNTASVSIPAGSAPALTIVKTETTGVRLTSVGQVLTYQYSVTNSGNAQFISDVTVFDDRISGGILCHNSQGGTIPFSVGSTVTCTANYTVTQADLDANSLTNTAFAVSIFAPGSSNPLTVQSPAVPLTVTGDPAPALTVAKTVSAGPNPAAVGDVLTYRITTTNSGNQTISSITVSDSRLPSLSCTIGGTPATGNVTLAPTQALVCTGTYTVTQADVNGQSLPNTATVGGTSPQGVPVSGSATYSHPLVTAAPALTVTKEILSPVPPALAYSGVGDQITYGITVRNSGNVTVNNVSVSDDHIAGTCTIATLAPGASDASCQFVQSVTQADIDAGSILNTATANGQPANPGASPVSGQGSVTAQGPDPAPGMIIAKTSTTNEITTAGQNVTYDYAVTNTGNVTITATPQVTDNRIGTFDCGAAPIAPGDIVTCQASYIVTQADIDAGSVTNIATADATGVPTTAPVSLTIPAAQSPGLSLTKTIVSERELFPFIWQTTFAIDVRNTGNLTLTSLDIQDNLQAFVAPATLLSAEFPVTTQVTGFASASANPGYNGTSVTSLLASGGSIAPGGSGRITVTATYSTRNAAIGGTNTATAAAAQLAAPVTATSQSATIDTDGDGIPDSLEQCGGADRDGDGICDAQDLDPTGYFYCEDNGEILSGGSITVTGPSGSQTGVGTSNNITITQDGSSGAYSFFVSAPGTYTLIPTYPSSGVPSTSRIPSSSPVDVTGFTANPAVLGSGETGSTGFLADFSAGTNMPSFLVFDIQAGDPHIINNNLAMTGCAGTAQIAATKVASVGSARVGESVSFTLTFTNPSSAAANDFTLVDELPVGMIYTPGSARVNGTATEPASAGNRLSWGTYDIPPGTTLTVTFTVRLGPQARPGNLTNNAWTEDGAGARTSNRASATVRIEPEHVFDCSDVIGKVFDDVNMNGYQDEGEPGIPRARVVTMRGVRITADEHGRFHVPCAELPSDIGTNFTLKLDTRSLPSGYRVTTENPRTIRLTAGKMAKLNFGAAIANVVDIDLSAAAFDNSGAPSRALQQGIDQLVTRLNEEPSVARLSYLAASEPREVIRARLGAVEHLLREAWRDRGRYKLNIERTIKRLQ